MRRALVIAILSFPRLDRQGAKKILRRVAAYLTRLALTISSRPYSLYEGRTLIFAPHQDDETMGCGGLIARKRNEGLPVNVVFITDGSASHPHHPQLLPSEVATIRRQEARSALSILGVESTSIHFLDEPDGTLHQLTSAQRAGLVSSIADILVALQPGEIFLPCKPDGSSEHDATFDLVLEALQRTHLQPVVWQYPIWAWWNPTVLVGHLFSNVDRVRLPTEDYALLKRQALARYRSQIQPLLPSAIPALPRELIALFDAPTEFFFNCTVPPMKPPANALHRVV